MSHERNEAHLVNFPAGHVLSTDCWCEPARMYWRTNPAGVHVFVVEHTDDTTSHHKVITKERNSKKDWITSLLDGVEYHT